MNKALTAKLWEALVSVMPVAVLVLILSFTPLAPLSWLERAVFFVSALLLVLGIGLFNLGADLAMTPMGRHVGEGLTKSRRLGVLVLVCFLMGVLITVAEPDLSVLAGQISAVIPSTRLILTVGLGVGLFLVLAILRIVSKTDLTAMLLFFYMVLFALSALIIATGGQSFLPLAFDSGGVTTGPITVPFIMALGLGIAQGMLPLVAFNYSVKNYARMREIQRDARIAGLAVAFVSITLYQLLAGTFVHIFISSKGDADAIATTISYGILFLRVRCLAAPFTMLNFVSSNGFQATGDGRMSLIQVFFRQVLLYFPFLYGFNALFGPIGLVAAYPAAEVLSSIISTVLLERKMKRVKQEFAAAGVQV